MPNEIKIILPKLYKLQQEIVEDPSRFKVICAGRRVGKTVMVQNVAINAMLQKKRVCYITPTFVLADECFDRLFEVLPSGIISKFNKTHRTITLVTGGSIRYFSGQALAATRGFEYDLILADECSQIEDLKTEWNEALRPLLLKTKGSAYFISTPYGMNYFFSLFQKGVNRENGFKSWQFSSFENPHLPKDELDELIKEMPTAVYQQEILAQPMANAANPFGIENINSNTISILSSEPTVVYGIDVTYGTTNDWTVIIGLDANGMMSYFDRFQLSNVLIQHKIEQLPNDILKVVDSTAGGQVLYENLLNTTSNLIGFKFTTESKPKLMVELIKDVELGKVKFNTETASEMHSFQYTYTSTGYVKYAAQNSFHDDAVMALAMANHHRNQAIQAQGWGLYFV